MGMSRLLRRWTAVPLPIFLKIGVIFNGKI
nr:MAG TPA: hypothetical protein [Caudoviricetes sp.]